MKRSRFELLIQDAIKTIPSEFRRRMKNIAIIVEDEPSDELLDEMDVPPGETLYGLYQGIPLTERPADYGNALPDRITIYQGPIEEDCETEEEMVVAIGETLIHEVGHYFGLSEDELEEIEDRYWRTHATEDATEEEEGEQNEDDEEDEGDDESGT